VGISFIIVLLSLAPFHHTKTIGSIDPYYYLVALHHEKKSVLIRGPFFLVWFYLLVSFVTVLIF
jgi:hypothetical protein